MEWIWEAHKLIIMSWFSIDLKIIFQLRCFNSYSFKKYRIMESIFKFKIRK